MVSFFREVAASDYRQTVCSEIWPVITLQTQR